MGDYLLAGGGAVIGVIITLIINRLLIPKMEARKRRKMEEKKKILSFKDIWNATNELCKHITKPERRYSPAYILGIDGGGCVVAALLGQRLNKPTIEFAADRTGSRPQFPKDKDFFEKLKQIVKDKDILLVDDLSNDSYTLVNAKKILEDIARLVKIAIISKPHSNMASQRGIDLSLYDYSIEEFDHRGRCTIEFPWEVWDPPCNS